MTEPTVGLALIVRDEEASLPTLLASVDGAFDQVVLCDTGSRDRTIAVFEEWASDQSLKLGSKVVTFEWTDDFAAARNFADSHLVTDWTSWADADDQLRGAENLRALAAEAPDELLGFVANYQYAHDQHGNVLCSLKRERLVRRGASEWGGRVHEAQLVRGQMSEVGSDVVEWVHGKQPDEGKSNTRNLRILRKWAKDEPTNPRVLAYLGTEEFTRGKPKRALPYFRRYLKLKTGWDEERAQVHRKLAICLGTLGEHRKAIATALEAIDLMPAWPDSYLTLAEAYHLEGEFAKSAEWAREVLRRGAPNTLLIINPLDYSFQPRLLLASALGGLGRVDEAIEMAEEALAIIPDHPPLREGYADWIGQRKREATARTWVAAAQQLVSHDEQLKALALLEDTVPYFARDHAMVVAARSELRERLAGLLEPDAYADHYRTGGSKPEDFVPDDRVEPICNALPRCRFLLEGLCEQLGMAPA
ncbi:MAG: glycosyltransferase [Thermoleophilaceae bacterium]